MSGPITTEELSRRIGHDLAEHPQITGSALAALADGRAGQHTPVGLRERVLTVIAEHVIAAAEPVITARVHARAVAEERQRALTEAADEVHGEAAWQEDQFVRSAPILQNARLEMRDRLLMVEQILRDRAAGSVPVATPQGSVAGLANICGECTEEGLGNCKHNCQADVRW